MIIKEYCPVCENVTKCEMERHVCNINTVCQVCGYIIDMDCDVDDDVEEFLKTYSEDKLDWEENNV